MILLIQISDARASREESLQAGHALVQVSPKECSVATVRAQPLENLLSYRRNQWLFIRSWRMEVEEVDRFFSTIFQLHFQVLNHPISMLPTEWTFQIRALQHLHRRRPDDTCVVALMRHSEARAAAAAHQRLPVRSKADADFSALGEQNHVSNFRFRGLRKVPAQRLFVLAQVLEASGYPAYVVSDEHSIRGWLFSTALAPGRLCSTESLCWRSPVRELDPRAMWAKPPVWRVARFPIRAAHRAVVARRGPDSIRGRLFSTARAHGRLRSKRSRRGWKQNGYG